MTIETSIQRIARLTPLDAILARVQTRIAAVAPRRAPISQSLGAVLAEDVRAAECPPRPIALRDGFAVAAGEIADAGPYAPLPLSLTARRIDTGEPLPSGTDAVAPLDAIALRGTAAEAIAPIAPGEGVLPAGADVAAATALRRAGERLRALDLAAMAAAGIADVAVGSPRLTLARAAGAKMPILDAAQATLSRCAANAGWMMRQTDSLAEALSASQCDVVIGIGGTPAAGAATVPCRKSRGSAMLTRMASRSVRAKRRRSALSASARCCLFLAGSMPRSRSGF